MSVSDPDIAVLQQKVHGRPAADYAEAIRERLPDREVAVARTPEHERELLRRTPVATGIDVSPEQVSESSLDYFACVFAGADHLPLSDLEAAGVAVTTASGVHGPNVAEYVAGALSAFAHGFRRAWEQQQRRLWRSFHTTELYEDAVCVVGMGPIGEGVVERLNAFGMETVAVRYTPEKGSGPADEVYGFDGFHEALARSDHLVLACPLTDETEGLVARDELDILPPDGIVVNVARGEVLDTDALVYALTWNELRGAALDVTDPEPLPEDHRLWEFDDVLITPHNAGHTPKYYDRMADILAENVRRADERGAYEDLRNQVV